MFRFLFFERYFIFVKSNFDRKTNYTCKSENPDIQNTFNNDNKAAPKKKPDETNQAQTKPNKAFQKTLVLE